MAKKIVYLNVHRADIHNLNGLDDARNAENGTHLKNVLSIQMQLHPADEVLQFRKK